MITSQNPNTQRSVGGVAEWLNAPVLKTDVGESLPWVRIPPPPPPNFIKVRYNNTLGEQRQTASPILSPNRFKHGNSLKKFRLPSKNYTNSWEFCVCFPAFFDSCFEVTHLYYQPLTSGAIYCSLASVT